MKKRGEITVFLSLVMVCILSLCMGLLESARTAGARLYGQMAAESAVASVMSQYNRNLWDMYHVLFLEAESEAAIEQSFSGYLNDYFSQGNLYPMKMDEVRVTGKTSMTEDGGRWLEESALSYVKYRLPDVAGDWMDIVEDVRDLENAGDFRELFQTYQEAEEQARDQAIDQELSEESEYEIDWEKASMLDRLKELFQGDLLKLVLPKGKNVSRKYVSLSGIPSKKVKGQSYNSESGEPSAVRKILVNEYCFLKYDSFLETCQRKLKPSHQTLAYEQEYLLCGKSSDRENLAQTAEKLLTVRGSMNLLCLLQSTGKQAEADTLALAVSGGNAPVQSILSFFILILWAFGEAVFDVKCLLNGGSVPFWKQESQWNVSLEQLLSLRFLDMNPNRINRAGYDYKGHLRVLFFLMKEETRNARMMDVMQWNLRTLQEDFDVEDCISKVELEVNIREQHLFLMKSGYQRTVRTVGAY